MTPLIEIGTSDQAILWQPHLLTDVMKARQLDDLALEPVLNPAGVSGAALFKVESKETSIEWAWGRWKRVEIRTDQVNGLSEPLNYALPQRPAVGWNELPAARAVELTFYSTDGVAGGCVRVEAPDTASFGRDVEFGQRRGDTVPVRVLNLKDSAGLSVEQLRLWERNEFRLKGTPIAFTPGQSLLSVPVSKDFFGIIAVVRNRHRRRSLIGYAQYDGEKMVLPNLSRAIDAEEFQKVRRWVEGDDSSNHQRPQQDMTAEEWLDNWPSNSRRRLCYLSDQAQQRFNLAGDDAHKVLRAYPTGLSRYLALAHCGYESSSAKKIIGLLNEGSFSAAVNTALPNLGCALTSLESLEEKTWAVRHADNLNLADAAAWAGNQGVAALERALHVLDKRSEARASWEARQLALKSISP